MLRIHAGRRIARMEVEMRFNVAALVNYMPLETTVESCAHDASDPATDSITFEDTAG